MPDEINYVSLLGPGHQNDFDRVFKIVFERFGYEYRQKEVDVKAVLSKAPLFFSWIDTKASRTFAWLCIGMIRALMGHRTVGLFFRPKDCFLPGSGASLVRRHIFSLARLFHNFQILSIVPFGVFPDAEKVASGWIYDPQLWDMEELPTPENKPDSPLERRILDQAKGRRIIVALGRQDPFKGFNYFAELWNASPTLREKFLFVSAGKISASSQKCISLFEKNGGIAFDELIENEVLFGLYKKAYAVWCCYAPTYDQSSGIHGRSVQIGCPAIVRSGSLIETLSRNERLPHIAIPFDKADEAIERLLRMDFRERAAEEPGELSKKMREHSLEVLRNAISL